MAAPRLNALSTAVPPYRLGQPEVALRAKRLFLEAGGDAFRRLFPVFENAGIDCRYSCAPIDWYDEPHGWPDRNKLYIDTAVEILSQAAMGCLDRAGLVPDQVDAIAVVSTTGIATPSLDALLINRLGLRPDVKRLPIFGLGCAGGVVGLARAADMVRAHPKLRLLFLVVELCAISFRKNDLSKSNIVATALFGDGGAAALISGEGDGPVFGASGEHTWPNTLDIMGWQVQDDGMKALFSRDIPALVRNDMTAAVTSFLGREGLSLTDIGHFVPHPGGVKVITALEEAFSIPEGTLVEARTVLRDFGNMSAATVWFVLERTLAAGKRGRLLMTALGPGFTAGFQLLDMP